MLLVASPDAGTPTPILSELRRLAANMEPSLESPWVKQWLRSVRQLKPVKPSTWYCNRGNQSCVTKDPSDPSWSPRVADDEFVYARVTDPLGYARPLDLLAATGFNPKGKKVLDFGYGNLGQLLMLAELGAEVHGVEVDALLPAATKSLVGKVGGKGALVLHHGYFPSDVKLVKELGRGFDLFLSKNTLKRGYVHPAEPRDAKGQIDLGFEDRKVLEIILGLLKPGGHFFIYNLAPAQAGLYKPMADARCPWPRELLEGAGFEVLAYDADDSPKARRMGHLLEWDADGDDLEQNLFATYTLLRRPVSR